MSSSSGISGLLGAWQRPVVPSAEDVAIVDAVAAELRAERRDRLRAFLVWAFCHRVQRGRAVYREGAGGSND